MARIRTIKPEFWTDEKLTECSVSARLFFIGLLSFSDDYGNIEHSPKRLKMQIFPADSLETPPLIAELCAQGILTEYSLNGSKYLHIKGFQKHQRINRPSKPVHPLPTDDGVTHGTLTESSSTEKEKEKEKDNKNILGHSAPQKKQKQKKYSEKFEQAWVVYPKRAGNNPKAKAMAAWNARLREGATEGLMLAGTQRYAAFAEATQKVGTEYTMQAATFYGPDKPFEQDWAIPLPKRPERTDDQWKSLGERVGVLPKPGESMQAYVSRVQQGLNSNA